MIDPATEFAKNIKDFIANHDVFSPKFWDNPKWWVAFILYILTSFWLYTITVHPNWRDKGILAYLTWAVL